MHYQVFSLLSFLLVTFVPMRCQVLLGDKCSAKHSIGHDVLMKVQQLQKKIIDTRTLEIERKATNQRKLKEIEDRLSKVNSEFAKYRNWSISRRNELEKEVMEKQTYIDNIERECKFMEDRLREIDWPTGE